MAIQQSINQLLSSTAWATGLYAHMPNVQKKREAKNFRERYLKPAISGVGKASDYESDYTKMTDEQLEKTEIEWKNLSDIFNQYSKLDPESGYGYRQAAQVAEKGRQETVAELEKRIAEREQHQQFKDLVMGDAPQSYPIREIIKENK